MFHRQRQTTLMSVAVAACVVFGGLKSTVGAWKNGPEMTGIGDITKTSPTGVNSLFLHYGGTGTSETANLKIDTTNAVDKDVCVNDQGNPILDSNGNQILADAGICAQDTVWTCKATGGTCTQGGVTTTFTPGNEVASGIWIKAKVFEGHSLSWSYSYNDAPVEKTWSDQFTTFKVTVYCQPGGQKISEDAAGPQVILQGSSKVITNILDLGDTGWTGALWSGGKWPVTPLSASLSYEFTLTAKAESESGQVGGIRGKMKFVPWITASGSMRSYIGAAGFAPIGAGPGSVVTGTTGACNPYVAAGGAITTWLMGTGASVNTALVGSSVIEFDPAGPKSVSYAKSADADNTTTSLAGLSASCTETTSMPSLQIRGSYSASTQLQASDDSITHEVYGRLNVAGAGAIQAGCKKPSYAP